MNKIPKVSMFFDKYLSCVTHLHWGNTFFNIPWILISYFSDANGPLYQEGDKIIEEMYRNEDKFNKINSILAKTTRIDVIAKPHIQNYKIPVRFVMYGKGKKNLLGEINFLIDMGTGEILQASLFL